MTTSEKTLEFDGAAFDDLAWWIEKDRAKALRIIKLIKKSKELLLRGPVGPNNSNTNCQVVGQGGLTENIVLYMKFWKIKSEFWLAVTIIKHL